MERQAAPMEMKRTRYSQGFKDVAFALADRIGVTEVAKELGIHASQLYQWRIKTQHRQSLSERVHALAEENARLKRQLAEKSGELEIAKKSRCISRKA